MAVIADFDLSEVSANDLLSELNRRGYQVSSLDENMQSQPVIPENVEIDALGFAQELADSPKRGVQFSYRPNGQPLTLNIGANDYLQLHYPSGYTSVYEQVPPEIQKDPEKLAEIVKGCWSAHAYEALGDPDQKTVYVTKEFLDDRHEYNEYVNTVRQTIDESKSKIGAIIETSNVSLEDQRAITSAIDDIQTKTEQILDKLQDKIEEKQARLEALMQLRDRGRDDWTITSVFYGDEPLKLNSRDLRLEAPLECVEQNTEGEFETYLAFDVDIGNRDVVETLVRRTTLLEELGVKMNKEMTMREALSLGGENKNPFKFKAKVYKSGEVEFEVSFKPETAYANGEQPKPIVAKALLNVNDQKMFLKEFENIDEKLMTRFTPQLEWLYTEQQLDEAERTMIDILESNSQESKQEWLEQVSARGYTPTALFTSGKPANVAYNHDTNAFEMQIVDNADKIELLNRAIYQDANVEKTIVDKGIEALLAKSPIKLKGKLERFAKNVLRNVCESSNSVKNSVLEEGKNAIIQNDEIKLSSYVDIYNDETPQMQHSVVIGDMQLANLLSPQEEGVCFAAVYANDKIAQAKKEASAKETSVNSEQSTDKKPNKNSVDMER